MSRIQRTTVRLGKQHNRTGFACGEPALDEYLARYASQNMAAHIAQVYVTVDPKEPKQILGYYTLSTASIACEQLPPAAQKKLPRYPVPAIRLGRLAVDQSQQGQGLGGFLLVDALQRAYNASQQIAAYALIVDAKHETAQAFYQKYGFLPLNQPLALYLPMETIAQLFPK